MSAFVCSDRHINSIVTFAAEHGIKLRSQLGQEFPVAGHEEGVAKLLFDTNVDSVLYRYPQDKRDEYPPITWKHEDGIGVEQFLQCIRCLDYQSCELPDWESRPAHEYLTQMERAGIKLLPEYEPLDERLAKSLIANIVSWAANQHGNDAVSYYWQDTRHYFRESGTAYAAAVVLCNAAPKHDRPIMKVMRTGSFKPVSILHGLDVLEGDCVACEMGSQAHAIIEGIRQGAVRMCIDGAGARWALD